MMKGSILDILSRIDEASPGAHQAANAQEPHAIEQLLLEGFDYQHIQQALDWRDNFFELLPMNVPRYDLGDGARKRIYMAEECKKLTQESRDFLGFLEENGVINPPLREFIISQAMAVDVDTLKTPYFVWVVYLTLEKQGNNPEYVGVLESAMDEFVARAEAQA